jgi:hypothetical protein
MRRADRERRRWLVSLTRQFLRDLERAMRLNVREAVRRERRARRAAAAGEGYPATALGPRRPRRRPVRPPPPPRDPEQIKRDAETQRLRALLRPADEEPPPAPSAPVTPSPTAAPPTTPGAFLRTLEKEIQDAVPFLGRLGPERCGAQIAAWAGQIRELREHLAPESAAIMRPAFRIFLEHLTELRAAMEAHFVDALEPRWSPPSWADYVEVNRARAEGRPPNLSADRLQAHHRAMLRALVLPHRKNVREQALPVIAAAATVLPADDGLLRSARRRHGEKWAADQGPEEDAPPPDEPLADEAQDASDLEPASDVAEAPGVEESGAFSEAFPEPGQPADGDAATGTSPVASPPPPASEGAEVESEFERPWTK